MNLKRKKLAQSYNERSLNLNKQVKSNKVLQLVRPEADRVQQSYTGNLAVSLTSFIGRKDEVEAICQLVNNPAVRLVTLYGTAGLGKTRLSLAVGEQLQNRFRKEVFFVNLASISKPESGLIAIAQALGLQDSRQLPLIKKLQNY